MTFKSLQKEPYKATCLSPRVTPQGELSLWQICGENLTLTEQDVKKVVSLLNWAFECGENVRAKAIFELIDYADRQLDGR